MTKQPLQYRLNTNTQEEKASKKRSEKKTKQKGATYCITSCPICKAVWAEPKSRDPSSKWRERKRKLRAENTQVKKKQVHKQQLKKYRGINPKNSIQVKPNQMLADAADTTESEIENWENSANEGRTVGKKWVENSKKHREYFFEQSWLYQNIV